MFAFSWLAKTSIMNDRIPLGFIFGSRRAKENISLAVTAEPFASRAFSFVLRKIAENQTDQIGDGSTLADPQVVEALVSGKQ